MSLLFADDPDSPAPDVIAIGTAVEAVVTLPRRTEIRRGAVARLRLADGVMYAHFAMEGGADGFTTVATIGAPGELRPGAGVFYRRAAAT